MADPFFTLQKDAKLLNDLQNHRYLDRLPLPLTWQPGRLAMAGDGLWRPCAPGCIWGEIGQHWNAFRAMAKVPTGWEGKQMAISLVLSKQKAVEALVYMNGRPYQGLDRHHQEIWLADKAPAGGEWDIRLETFTGGDDYTFRLAEAFLVLYNASACSLYNSALPVYDAIKLLPESNPERLRLLSLLDESLSLIDWCGWRSGTLEESFAQAGSALSNGLTLMEQGYHARVTLLGHSHIDVAWLWTLEETRQKSVRTFSTVLQLMTRYPEFYYAQSQPQLYQYVKEQYPDVFEAIKERVSEGRWETIGGMWVEADCNITGGESLIRQILIGSRFFEHEFGRPCSPVLWLPDVFGFCASLPQIIARSGLKYFMTAKLSANEYNKMPHDTFRWRGIDGTEVLTHFVNTPAVWEGVSYVTYNGILDAAEVKGAWETYKDKNINDRLLLTFGYGDGGGGPTDHMLEYGRRLHQIPGIPLAEHGTAHDFFVQLERKSVQLPVWCGELYFEYHRGTYTSQARNKRTNRQCEALYHTAEACAALAAVWGAEYPYRQLEDGWKILLLNQFHDILPGSSINSVYEESRRQYDQADRVGRKIQEEALAYLSSQINMPDDCLFVINPSSWERSDIVEALLPSGWGPVRLVLGDQEIPYQTITSDDQGARLIFQACRVPPYGYQTYALRPGLPSHGLDDRAVKLWSDDGRIFQMENNFFHVTLNESGQIVSFWDKIASRQVVAEGAYGNMLQCFEDRPLSNDAWDINLYYQNKMQTIGQPAFAEILESGPIRAVLGIRRDFLHSSMLQRITAYAGVPRLDFITEVDWHEKHVLLKAAFPVGVHAMSATYEIQFGNIERPTHWNTSWDLARFEVCAHKWADLSEGDYGVSLLNDCKYGHDIHNNVIRLSLLRSPTDPDPRADEGKHVFTYSLYPHRGDWRTGTVQRAYELNLPLSACFAGAHCGPRMDSFSLVRSSKPNVVIETIKMAEVMQEGDASEDMIVRVYEAYNQRGKASLVFGYPIAQAVECDLLERDLQAVSYDGNELIFDISPYQIRTFRVRLQVMKIGREN